MENQKNNLQNTVSAGRKYYPPALANMFRMGHCAPTVMQTILDVSGAEKEWLVRLSAGMPGGIGNTGHECGGVTSSLVMLGCRFGLRGADSSLPEIFERGHSLCQNFVACHRTLQCREIRGKDHFPRHCIPPVLRSPGLFMHAQDGNQHDPLPPTTRKAYTRLYAHMLENNFHCARSVLANLGYQAEKDQELFDAASAFIGGTLFMGRTCSAFTAGVMALGLREGEIENSLPRVIRLLAIMTVGGNAFDEKLNKFNRSMNRGYKLSRWFAGEFGSTQCQEITRCDFSDPAQLNIYIEGGRITQCKHIAEKVAVKVGEMLLHPSK